MYFSTRGQAVEVTCPVNPNSIKKKAVSTPSKNLATIVINNSSLQQVHVYTYK